MTQGLLQILKRAVVAALMVAALWSLGVRPAWVVALLMALAGAAYVLWPTVQRPQGALTLHRGSAVIGPDLVGFGLLAVFIALPVWIGRSEGAAGLHGSALIIWPLALAPVVILWVAAAGAGFWLTILPDGIVLSRLWRVERLRWSEISGWRPWRRGLPPLLRRIAPMLSPTAAGAVLLARDSTGIELVLTDGSRRRLPREGFEHALPRLQRALVDHGRPLLEPWPVSGTALERRKR